ncbi:MAG: hypothetical protein J5898_10480 [Lachnospiraceae bacterium]|nr:hypothetical protein [Lachnospiraceae bacterium]
MDVLLYGFAGILFVFFTITGRELETKGNIVWTMPHTFLVLSLSIVLGIVTGLGVRFLFQLCDKYRNKNLPGKERAEALQKKVMSLKKGTVMGLSFAGILLAWLPYYLAFYPGICAYDMSIQLGQAASGSYNLHHPLAHTLLLEMFWRMGQGMLHSATAGIALMVFCQMAAVAAAMAFGISCYVRRGAGIYRMILLQGICMFYPVFGFMSISVTKDLFFTAFFLGAVFLLGEIRGNHQKIGYEIMYVICGIGMQMFRNNGIYALLLLAVILFIAMFFAGKDKKRLGKMMLETCISLILGVLLLKGMVRITDAQQGDKREMLSVPIQQMARSMLYHGGEDLIPEDDHTMLEADRALIHDFLLYNSYQFYVPELADPVKSSTNTYVVRYRTGDFVRTYISLLKRYPGDLVNAFLSLNAGYLYMGDESHGRIYALREQQGLSYIHTRWDTAVEQYGIYRHSVLEGLRKSLTKWADENGHLKVPVLKYLFVPALYFWGYVLVFLELFRKKKKDGMLGITLAFGYLLTLFLGPCVQLRYLIPLACVLPFAFLCFGRGTAGDECGE